MGVLGLSLSRENNNKKFYFKKICIFLITSSLNENGVLWFLFG